MAAFDLITTTITIEGSESVVFYELTIDQAIAEVNSCTFIWQVAGKKPTRSSYVQFYQKYLSKNIKISVENAVIFSGLITSINLVQGDELGIHYEVKGKGLFARLDETPECNSFSKKTIKDIFTAVNTAGLNLKLSPASSAELFYTVQYNQTSFDFYRMLAMRHGEWLYDNGTELVLGPPEKKASSALVTGTQIDNITFSAQIRKGSLQSTGFDQRTGESLKLKSKEVVPGAELIVASIKAGESVFPAHTNGISIPHITTTQIHSSVNELHSKGVAAATVHISARSYSTLKLGSRFFVLDEKGGDSGEYIITEIHHKCTDTRSYENQFTAVPAEVEVPPYTNPLLFPICRPQPALVTNNVDKDGLDRIQVRFPWQKSSETSPWINILTPHAGKDKGFRFLPEIGEEVMIGFIDENAEKPFLMGAIHTEKNKSADAEVGNNLKAIGTLSGRRMEIDDDKGLFTLMDDRTSSEQKNTVAFERKDATITAKLTSAKSSSSYSAIELTNEDSLAIMLLFNGSAVAEIKMTSSDKKILIHAMGDVEIKADQDIKMSGQNISISAMQEVKIEGSSGVSVKGMKVALQADTTMDVKGMATTVEGSAKVDLKASGMASITGALVKIN